MSEAKKILICDDDPAILAAVGLMLSKTFEVIKSSSGSEAVRLAAQHKDIELVIMDYNMPGMRGDETTMEIALMPHNKDMLFILLSAIDAVKAKEIQRTIGAAVFLPKPFDKKTLLTTIVRLMQRKKK